MKAFCDFCGIKIICNRSLATVLSHREVFYFLFFEAFIYFGKVVYATISMSVSVHSVLYLEERNLNKAFYGRYYQIETLIFFYIHELMQMRTL